LSNSRANRPRVYGRYYPVKTTVLVFSPTPHFREWRFTLFFVYCDPIFDIVSNVSLSNFECERFVHRFKLFFLSFNFSFDLYYHRRQLLLFVFVVRSDSSMILFQAYNDLVTDLFFRNLSENKKAPINYL